MEMADGGHQPLVDSPNPADGSPPDARDDLGVPHQQATTDLGELPDG